MASTVRVVRHTLPLLNEAKGANKRATANERVRCRIVVYRERNRGREGTKKYLKSKYTRFAREYTSERTRERKRVRVYGREGVRITVEQYYAS